jgi:endonuclease/exonuclease/phosphatase family metal-dependent hydrolase
VRLDVAVAIDPATGAALEAPRVAGDDLVPRDEAAISALARRIAELDADIVCLQAVEHETALAGVNAAIGRLEDMRPFPHLLHCSSGDDRLTGVAVLSRLPLGPAAVWARPSRTAAAQRRAPVEVEVLTADASAIALLLFVVHLSDPFLDVGTPAMLAEHRRVGVQALLELADLRAGRRSAFAVVGTLGADPHAPELSGLREHQRLDLRDGLANARAVPVLDGTPAGAWTACRSAAGRPTFLRADHIWLSPYLAHRLVDAGVGRRSTLAGDGTDHDPAWVTVQTHGADLSAHPQMAARTPGAGGRVRRPSVRAFPLPAWSRHQTPAGDSGDVEIEATTRRTADTAARVPATPSTCLAPRCFARNDERCGCHGGSCHPYRGKTPDGGDQTGQWGTAGRGESHRELAARLDLLDRQIRWQHALQRAHPCLQLRPLAGGLPGVVELGTDVPGQVLGRGHKPPLRRVFVDELGELLARYFGRGAEEAGDLIEVDAAAGVEADRECIGRGVSAEPRCARDNDALGAPARARRTGQSAAAAPRSG